MRVICINAGMIEIETKIDIAHCHGNDLVEGKIYNVSSERIDGSDGSKLYFIDELQEDKLAERFKKVDDTWIEKAMTKASEVTNMATVKLFDMQLEVNMDSVDVAIKQKETNKRIQLITRHYHNLN